MQGVRTKEVTIISDNEVSRWHNPVQYGSNTFFLELGSDGPPPPGGGGWTWGDEGTWQMTIHSIQTQTLLAQAKRIPCCTHEPLLDSYDGVDHCHVISLVLCNPTNSQLKDVCMILAPKTAYSKRKKGLMRMQASFRAICTQSCPMVHMWIALQDQKNDSRWHGMKKKLTFLD